MLTKVNFLLEGNCCSCTFDYVNIYDGDAFATSSKTGLSFSILRNNLFNMALRFFGFEFHYWRTFVSWSNCLSNNITNIGHILSEYSVDIVSYLLWQYTFKVYNYYVNYILKWGFLVLPLTFN